MNRDGIRAERVKHNEAVRMWLGPGERKARVAQDDAAPVAAVAKVREVIDGAGEALDGGIEFVEGPELSWFGVGPQRPDTQPHDGNLGTAGHLRQSRTGPPEWSVPMVVA